MGKIHSCAQFPFDEFMRSEFTSVVRCYGPYRQSGLPQQPHHGMRQRQCLLAGFKFLHEHVTAFPFYKRHNGSFSVLSHDGVHLPVPYALPICFNGAVVYGDSVRYRAAPRLPRCLALSSAMAKVPADIVLVVW